MYIVEDVRETTEEYLGHFLGSLLYSVPSALNYGYPYNKYLIQLTCYHSQTLLLVEKDNIT